MHPFKIVGIGLPKTGTKSLGACMKHWRLRHKSFAHDSVSLFLAGELDRLLIMAEQFDSFEDQPWYAIYAQMDARFPGSKFILTRRRDSGRWYDSYCRFAPMIGRGHFSVEFRTRFFGHTMPQDNKSAFIAKYEEHNAQARAYFASRPADFLEVCWEEGDGWTQLASFLGLDAPQLPFPRENKTASLPGRLKRRVLDSLRSLRR